MSRRILGCDPLEERFVGKAIVLGLLLIIVAAFEISTRQADPARLPGVALGSPFLLDMERALVAAALVVSAAVFLIRGWAGYFPSKLSTTGAEYREWPSVSNVSVGSEDLRMEVADLRAHQLAVSVATQAALDGLAAEVRAQDTRTRRSPKDNQDDML